jgi:hypothetical protein
VLPPAGRSQPRTDRPHLGRRIPRRPAPTPLVSPGHPTPVTTHLALITKHLTKALTLPGCTLEPG